jgi:ribose transport system ATP-binding protein
MPILKLKQMIKRYPGVVALDNVDFSLEAGEVRALLGKNGAGKSTLVKILSGAVQQDSGTIELDGKPIIINNTRDAFNQGICTVYQEMSLVPGLSVAENILLGRWPMRSVFGIGKVIDYAAIRHKAQQSLDELEVAIDLDEKVSRLDVAEQQIVEIAKALSFNPRVLVLDEPTSALASHEVDTLHRVVRRLIQQDRAVIYVTHRLQEVPHVADSVTVLRDGINVGTIAVEEATPDRISHMMIGFDWERTVRERTNNAGDVKLAVSHLNQQDVLHDISFEVRAGEVLGIAGLMGSGRTELLRAIFGLDPIDSGEIRVEGTMITNPTPITMKLSGVGMTPEDRKHDGLVLSSSVKTNLTLASMHITGARGVVDFNREQAMADDMVENISIKTPGLDVKVQTLSGGNQQKVVIGNWLNTQPRVLIMDEPTRGIDIQAKEQIFELMRELAAQGLAVLFVSSEIEEVLDVADRIIIMNQGRITGEALPEDINLEHLLALVMEEVAS